MKILAFASLIIIAVAAIAFVSYGREKTWQLIFGAPDLGPIDMANITRSAKPNDGLICSPAACDASQKIDEQLPNYNLSPEALISKIETNMRASGIRYSRVDDQSDPSQIRFVTWTGTMRFPDTTAFKAAQLNNGETGLIGYARAQVGYSDMGNNLKRLKMLTTNLGQ